MVAPRTPPVRKAAVCDAILANLSEGDVFYDIGANVGVFSLLTATAVGDGGAVHAFEPEENNLSYLRKSVSAGSLNHVRLHDFAVGAADRSMTFDRRGGAFSGRLTRDNDATVARAVTVEMRSLDSLISDGLSPPTLPKIDVEGAEWDMQTGMVDVLRQTRPTIICELHSFNAKGVDTALACLTDAGYEVFSLASDKRFDPPAAETVPGHILARPMPG